jgi:hypothetical protein
MQNEPRKETLLRIWAIRSALEAMGAQWGDREPWRSGVQSEPLGNMFSRHESK